MNLKLFIVLMCLKIVKTKLSLRAEVDSSGNVTLIYSGVEVSVVTDADVVNFKIDDDILKEAVRNYLGGDIPDNVFLRSPTPWGDLYTTYHWEPVKRVVLMKYARVKNVIKTPVTIRSEDFENSLGIPLKISTGIANITSTLRTSWAKDNNFVLPQILKTITIICAKESGTAEFNYITKYGVNEEVSENQFIGQKDAMSTELQPGKGQRADLSASQGYLEIEVVYEIYLRGNLVVNYRRPFHSHHFWAPTISSVLKTAGIAYRNTSVETITFTYQIDPMFN